MPDDGRAKRAWDARFMQAIATPSHYMRAMAKLEHEEHLREKCGGCGRPFGDHADDFDECVRKVLALNGIV